MNWLRSKFFQPLKVAYRQACILSANSQNTSTLKNNMGSNSSTPSADDNNASHARKERQINVPQPSAVVDNSKSRMHEGYRILALEGDSGCVFCRIHGRMQNTLPSVSEHGSLEFATRSLLRMANITVARQLGRDRSMVGPLDYLSNLEYPERHVYTIELPKSDWPVEKRFPKFISHLKVDVRRINANNDGAQKEKTIKAQRLVTTEDCVVVDALWLSGKVHIEALKETVKKYKADHGIECVFGHSVFKGPGLLELSLVEDEKTRRNQSASASSASAANDDGKALTPVFDFPVVDATALDLSSFKCRVVSNDEPFPFLAEGNELDPATGEPFPASHWPRPVTYLFQPNYAHEAVYGTGSAGLFLETHDFTQSMTPANPDSRGFIVVGRWVDGNGNVYSPSDSQQNSGGEKENQKANFSLFSSSSQPAKPEPVSTRRRLELLALRIPYGYTILIDKGCIHGDTTFVGLYAMSMTTSHTVMDTADTVFVKQAITKKNIDFRCPAHNLYTLPSSTGDATSSSQPMPTAVREGLVVFRDATREELNAFVAATEGADFVLQPFSKLSWTTTLARRIGWYPGMPEGAMKGSD